MQFSFILFFSFLYMSWLSLHLTVNFHLLDLFESTLQVFHFLLLPFQHIISAVLVTEQIVHVKVISINFLAKALFINYTHS